MMKKLRAINVLVLVMMLLLFVHGTMVMSCMEEERIGLLKLKSYFSTYVTGSLNWVDDANSDCCGWERVSCDNTTHRRVIRLDLNHLLDYNEFKAVDASLFLPFQQLQHLDLSENRFSELQNYQDLRRLKKLEVLILSSNTFNGTIFQSLSTLASLRVLDLSDSHIKGSLSNSGRELCKLKNLEELNLAMNELSENIPECFSNLTSLKFLDLSFNQLSGNLGPFSMLPMSLEYLLLAVNKGFDANLMFNSLLDHESQFKYLDLSNCNLNASATDIVQFLSMQPDLIALYLSNNKLHGEFTNLLFETNPRLKVLVLRNNSFTGHIHFPLGSDIIDLELFDVSYNHLQGELHFTGVLSKLKVLRMKNNDLWGGVPASLGNMKDLKVLDLANNNFSGKLEESLGLNCQRLQNILLSNNKLDGKIPDTLFNLTELTILMLSNNQFTGDIPTKSQSFSLSWLDISRNYISGRIPSWLGTNSTSLIISEMQMQDNFIEGFIPPQLCNLTTLIYLDLSQNQFLGPMPSCLLTMPYLNSLHLQHNKLTGPLPKKLSLNISDLYILNLSHNNLSGEIPTWFGLLLNLRVLLLKENHFSGSIPHELCHLHMIGIMDLSHNVLSGSLPLCFTNITFGKITDHIITGYSFSLNDESYLDKNIFLSLIIRPQEESWVYPEFNFEDYAEFMVKSRLNSYGGDIISYMSGMDLSCNNLKGSIPQDIGILTELHALNLSHNQFTGLIPSSLSNMKQIESIDLSHNKLSGRIPSNLTSLSFLVSFNVAYNNLSGQLPEMVAQFSTFDKTSYEGNPFLCGSPLVKRNCNLNPNLTITTETLAGQNDRFGIDLISFCASFVATYVTCLLGFVIVLCINPYWRRRWFHFIDACLNSIFSFCSKAAYKMFIARRII